MAGTQKATRRQNRFTREQLWDSSFTSEQTRTRFRAERMRLVCALDSCEFLRARYYATLFHVVAQSPVIYVLATA